MATAWLRDSLSPIGRLRSHIWLLAARQRQFIQQPGLGLKEKIILFNIRVYQYILVMSGPPFLLDDLSQPLGHGHHQLRQIIIIHQLQTQQLHYLSLSLLHVLATAVPQFHLHPGSDVFYRIQVWTVYGHFFSQTWGRMHGGEVSASVG